MQLVNIKCNIEPSSLPTYHIPMTLASVEKDDEGHKQIFLALEPIKSLKLEIDDRVVVTPHTQATANKGAGGICTSREGIVRNGKFGAPLRTLIFIECAALDCQARYFPHP